MENSEQQQLSLLAKFDDLRRCEEILTDGTAEIGKNKLRKCENNKSKIKIEINTNHFHRHPEYRKFLMVQEESRAQWQATVAEAQRLQRELDKCIQERLELESKLFHARRLLENEGKARRVAETERDVFVSRNIRNGRMFDYLKLTYLFTLR